MRERKIVLMETHERGQITITAFDPATLLHEIHLDDDSVCRYTVQDMLDGVAKINPRIPIPTDSDISEDIGE